MQQVTKAGPQPPACPIESCDRPPVAPGDYCERHRKWYDRTNGTAVTPPIEEPDDPDLLEREQRRALQAEAKEYEDRRRVKTWTTLENGTRVPESWYSDEELAALDVQAAADVAAMSRMLAEDREVSLHGRDALGVPYHPDDPGVTPDPTRAQAKLFRRALRGKLGEAARAVAEAALIAIDQLQK
jgi:hypothetical protein